MKTSTSRRRSDSTAKSGSRQLARREASLFVHPLALCESTDVGPGTRVWAFAHVMKGARVGANCNICDHAFIEGGAVVGDHVTVKNGVMIWDKVVVEDYVFLGPGMVFTNVVNPRAGFKRNPADFASTVVKRGATLGANVTVVGGVTLGEGAFVGAGATVVKDVPAYALMVGNPARQVGWMCACGKKLPAALTCACGKRFRVVDQRSGLVPV